MKPLRLALLFSCFGWIVALIEDAGSREVEYGAELGKILVDKVMNVFIKLPQLEKKYKALKLRKIERNTTDIVRRKADILRRILSDKENMVKRIAKELEKLRNNSYSENLTGSNVTFFYQSPRVNGTAPETEPGITFYRNAKCGCEYQRPEDISQSSCLQVPSDYERNLHFGKEKVSFLNTSVHIPTEIYNEDPKVLKEIYLSTGLDDVLKREVCTESEFSHLTRWVYYTSQTGMMRFFPDRRWSNDCDTPDLYDSRMSPWFVNSVSSPKDVVVLLDKSGSIKGLTQNLLHRSVREFFDTLSTNDFINIVRFNKEPEFIEKQCQGLLQATPRNKQMLQKWVDNRSETKDQADYEPAFSQVLNILHNTEHDHVHTAKCNPMVMFFTDGDSTYPSKAMDRWNELKTTRVFSFAIGKNFYPKDVTKDIACKNRGSYHTIPSFTAAKPSVQQYLHKISEPKSVARNKETMWTLPYKDTLGLGFVLSVSVPVYPNNDTNDQSNQVAGVIGADILLDDLKKLVYDDDMNQDYFPFVIDNNGFAIIHPNLIEESHERLMTVNLAELEHEKIRTILQDIIDDNTAAQTYSKESYFDKRYMLLSNYKYEYMPIGGSKFKFGLGVHSSKLNYIDSVAAVQANYGSLTLQVLNNSEVESNSVAYLYSSPCTSSVTGGYNPCNGNGTMLNNADELYADGVPLAQFNDNACDKTTQLFYNLLLHAYTSDDFIMDNWEGDTEIHPGQGILAKYIATDTPSFIHIKYLNFSEQIAGNIDKTDQDMKLEIKKLLGNPRDSTYFRRATHKPGWTMYSYVEVPTIQHKTQTTASPTTDMTASYGVTWDSITSGWLDLSLTTPAQHSSTGYIVVTEAVKVIENDNEMTPVVTGLVIDPQAFRRNLLGLDWKCDNPSNCSKDHWDLMCNDTENVECIVLDDGGYLISSNQYRHATMLNKFIGLDEGELMRALIKINIYEEYFLYDYQAICETVENDNSAGLRATFVPTITDLISIGWWLSSCARMLLYTFFQNLFIALWSVVEVGWSHTVMTDGTEASIKREMCVQKYPVFNFGVNGQNFVHGRFHCTSSCDRKYSAVRIQNTNLMIIMIKTDDSADCTEACATTPPYSVQPVDATVETMCNNETVRYRKAPGTCYDTRTMKEADDSPCSSAVSLQPLHVIVALFTLLNLMINYRVL